MENNVSQTWKCPKCGEEGNTEKFCTKCGAPKPADKKQRASAERVFNAILSVVMIIFFATALIYIITPVIRVGGNEVGGYYFLWEAWPHINNLRHQGVSDAQVTIEMTKTIIGLVAFLAATVVVYFYAIRGLINSILVLKKGQEIKYAKNLAIVTLTTLIYYGIVFSLYFEEGETPSIYSSNGGGKIYAIFSMIIVLLALLIGSFVLGIAKKDGGKIATSAIRFVSGVFGISGVCTAMRGALNMAKSYNNTTNAFLLSAIKQIVTGQATGLTGEMVSGIMFLVVGIIILLAVIAGSISVGTGYASLVKSEKNSKISFIAGFASAGLIVASLVTASVFITLIDFGAAVATVNGSLATALTFTLIASVGLVVANLLEKN